MSLIEFQVTALDSEKTEKSLLEQITTHFNISPPVFCKAHLTKEVLLTGLPLWRRKP